MRKPRLTSTYVNSELLKSLFEKNNKLNKSQILEKCGLERQAKTVQRALKGDPISQQVVLKLADFFGINYEELTNSDHKTQSDEGNKVILKRIHDITQLDRELQNIDIVQKRYSVGIDHDFTTAAKRILDIVNNNSLEESKKKRSLDRNFDSSENEYEFLNVFAKGNEAIEALRFNNTYIYFGKWNVRYFEMTERVSGNPYEIESMRKFYYPVIKQVGLLLFSKEKIKSKIIKPVVNPILTTEEKNNFLEAQMSLIPYEKIIYPENIYKKDTIRKHFKTILNMTESLRDKTEALKHYDFDEYFSKNYHLDMYDILPYDEVHDTFDDELTFNKNSIFNYLIENKLTKDLSIPIDYQGEIVDVDINPKIKEAAMK